MAYAAFRRLPSEQRSTAGTKVDSKSFPAPTGGWLTATNLAGASAGHAWVMENWFPTSTGVRLRAGSLKYGTAGAGTEPVESLIAYRAGSVRELYAGCNGSILPFSSVGDDATVPDAVVTGQTANYYSYVNMETVGGVFMTAVNGADKCLLYDGSTWEAQDGSSTHAITGIDTTKFTHVWVAQKRLWFVEQDSMNAWYLPVNSIAGAANPLSLAGVFQKGGSLVLGAQWSANTGSGPLALTVFVSSEGEYAIYQGNDPSSADTWSLVGVYLASPPLGRNQNCFMEAGGDLLVLTQAGIVSLADIQTKDVAALSLAAITKKISTEWLKEGANRRARPWEIIKWPSRQMAIVNCPVVDATTPPISFVVNLETGAWCKYTGWDTRCLAIHQDQLIFGTNTGTLVRGEVTGSDQGSPYYSLLVGHMDHLGRMGRTKTTKQARAIFRALDNFIPKLSITTNYQVMPVTWPAAALSATSPGVWDVGLWDQMLWDTAGNYFTSITKWVDAQATGFAHAMVVQVTNGQSQAPSAELVVFDLTFETGALVN